MPALELAAARTDNPKAALLAETLDQAIGQYLEHARYPSRKVNEIDNRGSTFYLALYWAKALADQDQDPDLKTRFGAVASELSASEAAINEELLTAQGSPIDIGGYYRPDATLTEQVMRPSRTLNTIIDRL